MSHIGALGKDVGVFQSFPLACSYYHAAQGHEDSCHAILEAVDIVWQEYAESLRVGGKDEEFIAKTYRNMLGFCGWVIFAPFYTWRKQIEFADTTGLTAEESELILAQLGATAFKMMEWAWADDIPAAQYTLGELQALLIRTVSEDIKKIVTGKDANGRKRPHVQPRRSSNLRATGQRVSDAGMIESALLHLKESSDCKL